MDGEALIASVKYVHGRERGRGQCDCVMCGCGCGCDCVGVIVWVGVGVIAWVRKAVCGCDCVDMCEGVVIMCVRRGQGSLDEWCMFVWWCGGLIMWVGMELCG